MGRLGKINFGGLVVAGFCVAIVALETIRPLRRRKQSRVDRWPRNVVVGALAAATTALVERPIVLPIAHHVQRNKLGLLNVVRLPSGAKLIGGLLLLDYTLYLWHVATHKVPLLWRFHLSHHIDLDVDASTALRFHVGELTCSTLWRAFQVRVIGIDPQTLQLWQQLTLASIVFHHSNFALPPSLDRFLQWFVTTPRLHDVHHRAVASCTNSNWSSGLSVWDRMHGTLHLADEPPSASIGVPQFESEADVNLARTLWLPFFRKRRDPKLSHALRWLL